MLTAFAAIAARWVTARAAAGRFLNGNLGVAAIVVTVVLAILAGLWWLRHDAASDARSSADSGWRITLGLARNKLLLDQMMRDRRASAAAAAERAAIEKERDAAKARVFALEAHLATIGDDPVIYPRDLARVLRGGGSPVIKPAASATNRSLRK